MPNKAYQECLNALDGFANYERLPPAHYSSKTYSLKRVVRLTDALGHPEGQFPVIHVAGSKGKGSTSAMVAQVLKEAGYRTGLFTSPHLVDFRERMQIDGEMIPEEALCRLVSDLGPLFDSFKPEGITYFEVLTGTALEYFARSRVDVAVLEVGLGGRLDATNVVRPLCACITTLDLEHTDRLGPTIEDIAREKSGIIKREVPCVTTTQDPRALTVVEGVARARRASLLRLGREFDVHPEGEDIHRCTARVRGTRGTYEGMQIALEGWHQRINAAGVVAIAEVVSDQGLVVSERALRTGLSATKWPGRLQRLESRPGMILDCAHSRRSAEALVNSLGPEPNESTRRVVLMGFLADKDVETFVRFMTQASSRFVITAPPSPRAKDPTSVAEIVRALGKEAAVESDIPKALALAQRWAGPEGEVVVTGSVYLVGETLRVMGRGGMGLQKKS